MVTVTAADVRDACDKFAGVFSTTRGGDYSPQMIERFTRVTGDTLMIYYTMSTWNPYTVVKMRSEFKITR